MARVPRITGAFHGAMPSTTPQAWRIPIASRPGTSEGITSPAIWVVSAAASRSMEEASITLKPYQPATPPASAAPAAMNSGARACRQSAALSSRRRRSPGAVADQPGTAASASSRVAAAATEAMSPVAGLRRW
jgi:hypothetical protein